MRPDWAAEISLLEVDVGVDRSVIAAHHETEPAIGGPSRT